MKKYLYSLLLISLNSFAMGDLSTISPDVTLYSEYYLNKNTKFKGTIIFENGSGTDLSEWTRNIEFLNCVKKLGSLFFYDRNGLGKSPPDFHSSIDNSITGKLISDRLLLLLGKKQVKPPYVIVAHSYGAIYAGNFILKNPKLIKGVIFVDPVPKKFHFSEKLLNKYKMGVEEAKKFPPQYIYQKYKGAITEVIYQLIGFNQSIQSLSRLGNIVNSIPVIIISSSEMEKKHPLKEDWYHSQKQWLNLNVNSKILRTHSNHFIHLQKPKLVCDQISNIVNQ